MYTNVEQLGLNLTASTDDIIDALLARGDRSMLICPMFKSDYPNIRFGSNGERHTYTVKASTRTYISIIDEDISNGNTYYCGHDGTYSPWNSELETLETSLSERGKILGYLAQIPDTDTVQKVYDLTPYSGVLIVLNYNGFTTSDYIPLTGLISGTRVISLRPEEAYYCNAKYTFIKPAGSFQGTFRLVGTTKHNTSVAAVLILYGVK